MKLSIMAAVAALAIGGTALAQQPGGGGASPEMQAARQAMRAACAADFKTLCDGKEGREAFMCLRQADPAKVSQGCKDAVAKMPARPAPPAG